MSETRGLAEQTRNNEQLSVLILKLENPNMKLTLDETKQLYKILSTRNLFYTQYSHDAFLNGGVRVPECTDLIKYAYESRISQLKHLARYFPLETPFTAAYEIQRLTEIIKYWDYMEDLNMWTDDFRTLLNEKIISLASLDDIYNKYHCMKTKAQELQLGTEAANDLEIVEKFLLNEDAVRMNFLTLDNELTKFTLINKKEIAFIDANLRKLIPRQYMKSDYYSVAANVIMPPPPPPTTTN